jgi:BASS family bile acid:Na+ symporter
LIGLPFGLALGLRRCWSGETVARIAPAIDGLNVVLLLVFAVAVMDGVAARIQQAPSLVGLWLLAACAMSAFLHLSGYLLFRGLGWRRAFSVSILSGNRNMALMMAVTAGFSGPDFALYVALAQLPMYCVPLVFTPLVRRRSAL